MGNLAIATAGGIPTVDRDNLLMEQPLRTAPAPNKPKLTVGGSADSDTLISLNSKSSSKHSRRQNLMKLKNTQQQSSLSNQSIHSTYSSDQVKSRKLDSKQSTLDDERARLSHHSSNELKAQLSGEEASRSVSSNPPSDRENGHSSESIGREVSKEASREAVAHQKRLNSRNALSRQATSQSDQSDGVHSDSGVAHRSSQRLKPSSNNSKSDIDNVEQPVRSEHSPSSARHSKKPASKSIENLSAKNGKAATPEQRRSRLKSQLSHPSASAPKDTDRPHNSKVVSSVEI